MDAIRILNNCREAARDIQRMDERIARYRACLTDSSAHISTTGRVQSSGGGGTSAFAVEILDAERERDARIRQYKAESYCACKLLDTLPERECSILYRYYLNSQTVGEIAAALGCTAGYVKQRKAYGLQLMGQVSAETVAECMPDWYGEG